MINNWKKHDVNVNVMCGASYALHTDGVECNSIRRMPLIVCPSHEQQLNYLPNKHLIIGSLKCIVNYCIDWIERSESETNLWLIKQQKNNKKQIEIKLETKSHSTNKSRFQVYKQN